MSALGHQSQILSLPCPPLKGALWPVTQLALNKDQQCGYFLHVALSLLSLVQNWISASHDTHSADSTWGVKWTDCQTFARDELDSWTWQWKSISEHSGIVTFREALFDVAVPSILDFRTHDALAVKTPG